MDLRLSLRATFAIRVGTILARHAEPVTLRGLLAETAVPRGFAAQVLGDLRKSGLVSFKPGPPGGYRLTRPAGAVSVAQVVEAVEGPLWTSPCAPGCRAPDSRASCVVCGVAQAAGRRVSTYLEGIAIDELLEWPTSQPD